MAQQQQQSAGFGSMNDLMGFGGDGKAPSTDPNENRYMADLQNYKATAAFGIMPFDVLKAKSGGRQDMYRDILITMRQEFFTFSQVTTIIFFSMALGCTIGALTVAITGNVFPDVIGPNASFVWSVFLLSFGLTGMYASHRAKRSSKKCLTKAQSESRKLEVLDEEFQGIDCLEDWDCMRKAKAPPKGACSHPKPGPISNFIRWSIMPLIFLGGLIWTITVYVSNDQRAHPYELSQAIIYGIGFSVFTAVFFS